MEKHHITKLTEEELNYWAKVNPYIVKIIEEGRRYNKKYYKEYNKEYFQRPEVKERTKEYHKEYYQRKKLELLKENGKMS